MNTVIKWHDQLDVDYDETVSEKSLIMRTQCQRSHWLCRHSVREALTMWTQCQRSHWLCGHSVREVIDYADTVSEKRWQRGRCFSVIINYVEATMTTWTLDTNGKFWRLFTNQAKKYFGWVYMPNHDILKRLKLVYSSHQLEWCTNLANIFTKRKKLFSCS